MAPSTLVSPFSELTRINLLVVRRESLTLLSHIITALIWTAAVVHVIAQRTPRVWARVTPVLARVAHQLSVRIDPATAPLFQPITAADIEAMQRDQLFMTRRREWSPTRRQAANHWISVGDVLHRDLMAKPKAELMKLAGTESASYTKEQLISRIEHGPAQQPSAQQPSEVLF